MLSLLTQSIVVGSQNKYERSQFVEGNFLEVTNIAKPSVIRILATSAEGDLWKTVSAPVNSIKGVHDLYFVFRGEKDLFNFDRWMFKK